MRHVFAEEKFKMNKNKIETDSDTENGGCRGWVWYE